MQLIIGWLIDHHMLKGENHINEAPSRDSKRFLLLIIMQSSKENSMPKIILNDQLKERPYSAPKR